MNGKLIITLKSDACPSSGDVWNSSVDTDVCYDDIGIPYIPAKRIKGCLREAALELNEWNYPIHTEKIFGTIREKGALTLSSARIKGWKKLAKDLQSSEMHLLSQDVLHYFTDIRVQTSIDEKTGTAKEGSLRVTRVLRKGLVFEAPFSIDDSSLAELEACCKNLKRFGGNRTRGFGEIEISVQRNQPESTKVTVSDLKKLKALEKHTLSRLDYSLELRSPVRFSSAGADNSATDDYIQGAKVLGAVAQVLGQSKFLNLMNQGDLVCSDALISRNGKRSCAVSCALKSVKDSQDPVYYDMTGTDKGELAAARKSQLENVGGYIIFDENSLPELVPVRKELHYHHARPTDKSIGRPTEKDGAFYQIESLSPGQIFMGSILGSKEQIIQISEAFGNEKELRMGNSRGAEYGDVLYRYINAEPVSEKQPILVDSVVLKLETPVILYSENAAPTTSQLELVKAVEKLLNCRLIIEHDGSFLKYSSIGGYNTTWRLPKPVINVLDRGTTLILRTGDESEIDISGSERHRLGERISEGFGEFSLNPRSERVQMTGPENRNETRDNADRFEASQYLISRMLNCETWSRKGTLSVIQEIEAEKLKGDIRESARIEAVRRMTKDINLPEASLINTLLTIFGEQKNLANFKHTAEVRYDKSGLEKKNKGALFTNVILSNPYENADYDNETVCDLISSDEVYKVWMGTMLEQMKYHCRKEKVNARENS